MKKISIITVCYNSSATIKETIDSVLCQNYKYIEYIVVDGKSNDGTQDIIKSYGDRISKFISEEDLGLYDAMNKGIEISTGDIIGILNSDDLYFNDTVISEIMTVFHTKNSNCVFADLFFFRTGSPDKVIRHYKGKGFNLRKIKLGILPPHPTFFVEKSIYNKFGKFDLQFKYAADFDLMCRFLLIHQITFTYLPMIVVRMRLGGVSTSSFKRIIEINKEDIRSYKKNNIKTNFILFHMKYFLKIFQIRDVIGLIKK